jgi:hypothetical protein
MEKKRTKRENGRGGGDTLTGGDDGQIEGDGVRRQVGAGALEEGIHEAEGEARLGRRGLDQGLREGG